MSTLAGSWIGGGANQAAMLEIFEYNPQKYGGMVLVDIVVANIWMAIILFGIGKKKSINKWLKADTSAIEELKAKHSTELQSLLAEREEERETVKKLYKRLTEVVENSGE